MPGQKPPRKRLGFFDAQDRVIKLNNIYRTEAFGADRSRTMAGQTHRELDDVFDERFWNSFLFEAANTASAAYNLIVVHGSSSS